MTAIGVQSAAMTPRQLRRWMEREGYSVRSLAERLGVEPSTVQRWRDGSRTIPPFLELALERVAQIDAL